MKMNSAVTLVGLAVSFAVPTFAQQKDTADPEITQKIRAISRGYDDAANNNNAAGIAALFTEDAVFVTDTGPVNGRQAIEKWYAAVFQQVHITNHIGKVDQGCPHIRGMAGNEVVWETGEWSESFEGKSGGPMQHGGYWSAIDTREGDDWKIRVLTYNITPAPPPEAK
jgi:ketosteroid isomerase-like protein